MKSIRSCLYLILLCAAIAAAEDDYARVFSEAKALYAAGRYDAVTAQLRPWVKAHGKDPAMEELVPLLLESLIRGNDRASFKPLCDIYLKKFPASPFIPRVQYLSGMALSDSSAFAATRAFSATLKAGARGELATLALRNVELLAEKRLSTEELTGLFDRSDLFGEVRTILGCALASRLGKTERADEILALVRQGGGSCTPPARPPETIVEKPFVPQSAVQTPPPAVKPATVKTRIGLLAPLSGANADTGRSVARGAELAVALAEKRGLSVELISLDTRGNYLETVRRTHELLADKKVPVIIGPVLSIEAAVAAGMVLEQGRCVLISPTATEEGIAGLSPRVFQLNLTLPALARSIASHAVTTGKITEFAILAPKSTYGKTLADHFRLEVKRRGGVILAEETFAEGGADMAAAVARLRTTAGGSVWARAVTAGTPIEGYPDRPTYLAASDAALAAEALAAADLSGQLLGSSGWQEPGLFAKGKEAVEGALISGSAASGPAFDSRLAAFSELYTKRYGEAPDHVAAPLGYDAANLALEQIAAGHLDATSIAAGLVQVINRQGVSGKASFDGPDGANTAAAVLRVTKGSFTETER